MVNLPSIETKGIPTDYLRHEASIKVACDKDYGIREAHQRCKEILAELEGGDKLKAVLKYCLQVKVRPDRTGANLVLMHNPETVLEKLTDFEQAVGDPNQAVLLTASPTLNSDAQLIHGDVAYTPTGRLEYWEITVGECPPIHLGNITRTIWRPEELAAALRRDKNIELTPLVGIKTILNYAAKYLDKETTTRISQELSERVC